MSLTECDERRREALSECEIFLTQTFYNPPYSLKVKNDFGGGIGGGKVWIDGELRQNIPQDGIDLTWGVYDDPHTVAAEDYQEIEENSVVYVREYDRWTDHLGNPRAERPVDYFQPTVGGPIMYTYTASFLKLFNVTFADPLYIEPGGNGGYYTVDGEPATSTVILQNTSKLIAAVPPEGWFFVRWSDNHADKYTNPRTLAPTDHVENLSATFKAHLGSSLATATFSNSQRKYAADVGTLETKVALCYSSADEIWLSESTDMWSPFTPEVRVSNGSGGFDFPSVVVAGRSDDPMSKEGEEGFGSTHVAVVYQKDTQSSMTVYFREKRADQWFAPVVLVSYPTWYVDAMPVIGRTGTATHPQLVAVWVRENYGLWGRTATWSTVSNSWSWYNAAPIPGTDGGRSPSISSGYKEYPLSAAPLYLTYDNGSTVYLQKFENNWVTTPLTVPASVTPTSYGSQVSADTRSAEVNTVHVVWEADYLPDSQEDPPSYEGGSSFWNQKVMYQAREDTKWDAAHEFKSNQYNFHRPTVSVLSSGNVVMAWDDGNSIWRAIFNGSSWEAPVRIVRTLPASQGTSSVSVHVFSVRLEAQRWDGAEGWV
jgi:hypothetical protein